MRMKEFRVVMKCLREENLLSDEGLKFWEWIEFFDKIEGQIKEMEKAERIDRAVADVNEVLQELPEDERREAIDYLSGN